MLIVVVASGCATLPEPDFDPGEPALRVVTYNVNWGAPDPGKVARFLAKCDADIVCLQETHPRWEIYLKNHLSATYAHSSFRFPGPNMIFGREEN